eukprot:TRINITY_DN30755_c0_g1_i1.p1 TRINITY_DN30755_c0_g1~~TRINITY_DN30755_c0_g1_i1.p1  ORF type:complete len:501 (-),score=56.13 TRINITY_DN30755_c0_g1_i1:920-2368(-)
MTDETPLQRLRRQVKHKDGDTRGIARAFMEVWDKDGSGELSRSEFLHGLKQYGVLVGDMTEADKKALWAEFDASGNGSVDLHEFLLVLGEVYQYRIKLINEAFNKLDQDGSGEISVFEMKGRQDILKYFDNPSNPDGFISRLEFVSYCSALSSACDNDEDFKKKLEELTDVPSFKLPAWKYFHTDDPSQLEEWINKQFVNPFHVMGGFQQGTMHVWTRPGKRSYIKGCFSYEFVKDDGMAHIANKKMMQEQGTGILLDVDSAGAGYFLRMKTKPKRGTRLWYGKQRYLFTNNLEEAEAFINELEPMPHNINAAIQWPDLHIFVNDMGQAGYKYHFHKEPEIPYDLVEADKCLILGFNDDGDCFFLEIPQVETNLCTLREPPPPTEKEKMRTVVRNPELGNIHVEGIYDSEDKLRGLFDMVDVDNSGYITNAELAVLYDLLPKFGVESGKDFAKATMEQHNMMDDDILTFEEFSLLMLKIAQW